jgi:MFS family permease
VSDPQPRETLITGRFALTTASAFAYFLVVGMLVPSLPHYVEDVLGGSTVAVGVAVGAFGVTAALMRPVVGATGDRRGRRILVVGGSLVVAVSLLGYAMATSVVMLVGARLVTGIGEAAVFVGAATAAQDLAPDSRRAEAASYFSVAIYGGQGLGPVLAEALRTGPGYGWVWGIGIALCALAAFLGAWVPVGALTTGRRPWTRDRLYHPAALAPGSVLLLSLIGFGGFTAFVSLYLDELGGGNAGGVFLLYSAIVLTVRIFGARLADERGPKRVAAVGIVLIGLGLVLAAAWRSEAAVYLATAILAPGVALQYPALMAICMAQVAPEERTSAVASMTLSFDLSQSIGLPILGTVASFAGYRGAFATGALAAAGAFLLLRRSPDVGPTDAAEQPLAVGPE